MPLRSRFPLYSIILAWAASAAGTVLIMSSARSENSSSKANPSEPAAVKTSCEYRIQRLSGFGHTRPLLSAEPSCESPRYAPLKSRIIALIDSARNSGGLGRASVYLRDFEKAEWMQVNGQEQFEPGSLMKVPTMLAKLMMAERNPAEANRTYRLDQELRLPHQQFPPSRELELHKTYSLMELLRFSIQYSSNRAEYLLLSSTGEDRYRDLLLNIGLHDFPSGSNSYPLSAPDYAQFFKALYNASVLSPPHADSALDLLVHSDFALGIRRGVPQDVEVASKFGETGEGDHRQLHEAGIVYSGHRPYLIVVMTEGADSMLLADFIAEVSRVVHLSMTSRPGA